MPNAQAEHRCVIGIGIWSLVIGHSLATCLSQIRPPTPYRPKKCYIPGPRRWVPSIFVFLFVAICFDICRGQNIIAESSTFLSANPAKLTETDFSEFIAFCPDFRPATNSPSAQRISGKLEAHIVQFLDGNPWMPFHQTLGISGYEVYFNHPDEMYCALSVALPMLSKSVADRIRRFLSAQLEKSPPYAVAGFDNRAGQPRESYEVPAELRISGQGNASSTFGVYAFWAYCHNAADDTVPDAHWSAVKMRMKPLLEAGYAFDITKRTYSSDEAQKLNGDLAGLVGLVRLARMAGDRQIETQAVARGIKLLELRINLERLNTRILEPTHASTKHLHNFKLARYCHLAPEIGEALRKLSAGCGAAHFKNFREERNGWYLAYGDRLIGGENYTNPLHFPRSLFAGAVFVEQLPASQVADFIDVPWCKADFSFIEKCCYALWAESGRAVK